MTAIAPPTMLSADLPPEWALRQRHLFDVMNSAGPHFVRRYTRDDGSLIWRDSWPGMDGSDDGYESFYNFPLLYALGGSEEIHRLSRIEWDAITRQFTEYGQVYREFDAYYDWMHHGESSIYFYCFGLADPTVQTDRARALQFAAMYTGDDPAAPNFDPDLKMIRSPINGSRGPRFVNSSEDWSTHRSVLANYPPPFDDLPGVTGPTADWTDDALFEQILERMNSRMMRGDVPLNLTATSLVTHAYLLTQEPMYREWVLDYTEAWWDRVRKNSGRLPDNVGPSGRVGELMAGRWWGGYYGWQWPHGWFHLIEPVVIAGMNAVLLSGDTRWLDVPRGLIDRQLDLGREENGVWVVPHRHTQDGWCAYRPMSPIHAIHLWSITRSDSDRDRVERIRRGADWTVVADARGKGEYQHAHNWYTGTCEPDRYESVMEEMTGYTYREVGRRLRAIDTDDGNPSDWDVHHWQDLNPVCTEALVHMTLGAPAPLYHGGLLHAPVRYFNPVERRPGLPASVSARVQPSEGSEVRLTLANLHPIETSPVTVQAGGYGEHRFTSISPMDGTPGISPATAEPVRWVTLNVPPRSSARFTFGLERFTGSPDYTRPWD